jgi:hypothetical protein
MSACLKQAYRFKANHLGELRGYDFAVKVSDLEVEFVLGVIGFDIVVCGVVNFTPVFTTYLMPSSASWVGMRIGGR